MRRLLPLAVLALVGCFDDGTVAISFTGTISENGTALEGARVELFRPDAGGLPQRVGETTSDAQGTYSLGTVINELRCFLVYVEVEVADPAGGILYESRANAQECGQNVSDFDF